MGRPNLLVLLIQQHGFYTTTTTILVLNDAISVLYGEWTDEDDDWQLDTPETMLARDGQSRERMLNQHWPRSGEYHESIHETLKNAWIQRTLRIKRARKKGSMSEWRERVFRSKQLAPDRVLGILEESFVDICAEPTLSVNILEAEGSVLVLNQWYSPGWAKRMRKELGAAFASLHGSSAVLHQNVVTMRALQHLHPTQVHSHPKTWLAKELRVPKEILPYLQQVSPVVVFLSHTVTTTLCQPHFRKVLQGLTKLRHLFGIQKLRTLPCDEESEHYHSKSADVRILDSIAHTRPDVFAYRPQTCLGFTACTLRNEARTVFKHSHSDSGFRVQVKPQGVRDALRCTPPSDSN
ncbi:hypothetical protein LTR17_027187 [Elasticomyces elasticus]|nr:hypothetical protein LTR17_027187 [Elasticomyces elasticus]